MNKRLKEKIIKEIEEKGSVLCVQFNLAELVYTGKRQTTVEGKITRVQVTGKKIILECEKLKRID